MDDAPTTLNEEAFSFPEYAGLVDHQRDVAYALARVQQLRDTRIVPVRVGPGHLDQAVVYEHMVSTKKHAAVLLRSAWLRPVGSMDGARPVIVQVLVDGVVALEETIDQHLRAGYPLPQRLCACNNWQQDLECKCPVAALSRNPKGFLFSAVKLDDERHALGGQPYGIFAPDKTLVQIRVVKPGSGPVDFQARCGITAALYSTSTKDVPA